MTSHNEIQNQLKKAFLRNEFKVHYQAQFDIKSNKVAGFEALIRWQKKEGLLSPESFLKDVENSGLMPLVGMNVLNLVFQDIAHQKLQRLGITKVAINLSYQEISNERFVQHLLSLIQHFQIDPTLLTLELTESDKVQDLTSLNETIQRLRETGISFALDDFCTGCSCLSHLRALDIDYIKIDRSFITHIAESKKDYLIVQNLIAVTKALGIKSIIEGVENHQQLQLIRSMNADWVQGYLFSKPQAIEHYLSTATPASSAINASAQAL
ncbi:EAL domain-containing protein [Litoribacillus peritrichatus]|uniref:EAL domain-containing protein n=1 Tax=Litoribacillus peritrichatus TaxID=718191 RepID=A0ABP7MSD2_9GAMM